MSTPSYIPSLDGLRAVSILLVFVAHVGFGHIVPGGFGVTVFFFLSGYLITTLLTREWDRHGSISLSAFYLRRLLRLGPPILVTLAFSLTLAEGGLAEGGFHLMTVLSQVFFFFNYYHIYSEASLTVAGQGILWSLSVEEHFYLIWPTLFILFVLGRIGVGGLVALLVAIALWRAVRHLWLGTDPWVIYTLTDTRFDSLLFGCLLALLMWRGQAERLFPTRAFWPYFIGAMAVLLACFVIRDDTFRSVLRYSLQGLALMPLFYYAVTRADMWLFQPLNWTPVRLLGQWSYTFYLVHFVIIKALVFNGVSDYGEPLLIALSFALSVAFSAAVFRWVEQPFHPVRKRLTGH